MIIQKIGMVAAVALPLWNIPLIIRIIKRKSSEDISLSWAIGVWVCIVLMAPAGMSSPDKVWKIYNVVNLFFFSAVTLTVILYHKHKK